MSTAPLIHQLEQDLHAVIEKYNDSGMTLGETVGALECVKMNVYKNQTEEEDEL